MQSKLYAILVTIIGILLILPLIGVGALGDVTQGISAWLIAIAILIIGIVGIVESFS